MRSFDPAALSAAMQQAGVRLILASGSPRRRQLMAGLDLPFHIEQAGEVEEILPPGMLPDEAPAYLARLKSLAFRPPAAGEIVITADTVVICEGQLLGKPADRAAARRMLQLLSGRRHEVLTGVYLRSAIAHRSFTAQTTVVFRRLSPSEIAFYLDRYQPYDKAGAYGAQEWLGFVGIERIEGSYFNVMGLPLQPLYACLSDWLSQPARSSLPDR
ncbi:MAG: Maf family protein [Prevotellaceae bacterium]|jgi:septum formation protein|nr:Maf family protein [Prevotellaceae bacterium]